MRLGVDSSAALVLNRAANSPDTLPASVLADYPEGHVTQTSWVLSVMVEK